MKKGDRIKIEIDNKSENTVTFQLNDKAIAKGNLNDIKATGFRVAIVSF